jgi:hypothetical protein
LNKSIQQHSDRRAPEAPATSKTARHRRTNKPQNRTENLPNAPSEIHKIRRNTAKHSQTQPNTAKKQQPKNKDRDRQRFLKKRDKASNSIPSKEHQKHFPAAKQQQKDEQATPKKCLASLVKSIGTRETRAKTSSQKDKKRGKDLDNEKTT